MSIGSHARAQLASVVVDHDGGRPCGAYPSNEKVDAGLCRVRVPTSRCGTGRSSPSAWSASHKPASLSSTGQTPCAMRRKSAMAWRSRCSGRLGRVRRPSGSVRNCGTDGRSFEARDRSGRRPQDHNHARPRPRVGSGDIDARDMKAQEAAEGCAEYERPQKYRQYR